MSLNCLRIKNIRNGFLITARFESSRLPGKVVANINGKTALDLVIDRANVGLLHPLYLCTGDSTPNNQVAAIGEARGVTVFRGSTPNKLHRWLECAQKYKLDTVTILEADDLFFDWSQTRTALQKLISNPKIDVILPHKRSSNGSGEVGITIRVSTLKQIVSGSYADYNQQVDVVDWPSEIKKVKGNFMLSDSPFLDVPQTRMTLDYEEDLEILRWIDSEKGPLATREDLEHLCQNDSSFLSQMNSLNKNFVRNKESGE